jgi:hypothetical protein
MYYRTSQSRAAGGMREDFPAGDRLEAAQRALRQVRKVLTAFEPGLALERRRWQTILTGALAPELETERLVVLGWLRWLEGDCVAAEPLLAAAVQLARADKANPLLAEAAYWCGRMRILLGRGDAVPEFEGILRTLGGSPQATAWFVDLLGRAGRVDRCEQVWKSVRTNRRVTACEDGQLLEGRSLLRRGEAAAAERVLTEANPGNGVLWVERRLLLAWALAAQKQFERARAMMTEAERGPYPASALRAWREFIDRRDHSGPLSISGAGSIVLHPFLTGQQARLEGKAEEACAALQAARDGATQPFARYALACLGQDDHAAVLAAQPGLFLAVRCRLRLALARFSQRDMSPAEYLEAFYQASAANYRDTSADHFRRLAMALQQRQPTSSDLNELLADDRGAGEIAARNIFRAALELAVLRLSAAAALPLFLEWARTSKALDDDPARQALGRQLLWQVLLQQSASDTRPGDPKGEADLPIGQDLQHEALTAAEAILPGAPLLALAPRLLDGSKLEPGEAPDLPAAQWWRAAQELAQASSSTEMEAWRSQVGPMRSQPRLKSLAQALLVREAAGRGDLAAVAGLLEEREAWSSLRSQPPRFLAATLAALVSSHPGDPMLRRALARWLPLWGPTTLGPAGSNLAAAAGLAVVPGVDAESPSGVPPAAWFLHQAARALGREDAVEALSLLQRAREASPAAWTEGVVKDALPELEWRAQAQQLAACLEPEAGASSAQAGALGDFVQQLADSPQGQEVLQAAMAREPDRVEALLASLGEQPGLPARLAHHLALIEQRKAPHLEERDQPEAAEASWRRAWRCWLRFLAAEDEPTRNRLLDWLLGQHRQRVNDLLARNLVDRARRHWNLVQDLPALAASENESLAENLTTRAQRFREDLATEYLLTTREAMRYGDIPEGWHADYEKGLSFLRRLLSLERDNPRLLTALVEICGEWFLDLYNVQDTAQLSHQVDRFTPFALQLARLVEGRTGDLAAGAALANYWKFRGFVATERAQKITLYREALRFNPSNGNVRELLADLGEAVDSPLPAPDPEDEP